MLLVIIIGILIFPAVHYYPTHLGREKAKAGEVCVILFVSSFHVVWHVPFVVAEFGKILCHLFILLNFVLGLQIWLTLSICWRSMTRSKNILRFAITLISSHRSAAQGTMSPVTRKCVNISLIAHRFLTPHPVYILQFGILLREYSRNIY